jgi:hypothetical protein
VDSYYKDKHYALTVNPVVFSVASAVGKLYSWLFKDVAREEDEAKAWSRDLPETLEADDADRSRRRTLPHQEEQEEEKQEEQEEQEQEKTRRTTRTRTRTE